MRKLNFIGTVEGEKTGFASELLIPGRDELFLFPEDWPTQLAPGTVNIQIKGDGFPNGFDEIGAGAGLKKLDEGKFRAALVIPQRKIAGNPLTSDSEHIARGFAQVWHADFQIIGTGQETTCWMLRIIGSEVTSEIELVDEQDLRSQLNLANGAVVKVTLWEQESNWMPPGPNEWIADWCEAARNVEGAFGREKAMSYLIGEKFLNFLEAAETNREWREAIPAFVTEVKGIFDTWQLAQYLEVARQTEPFDPSLYDETDDPEEVEMERKDDIRRCTNDLLLVEWARGLLLDDGGP